MKEISEKKPIPSSPIKTQKVLVRVFLINLEVMNYTVPINNVFIQVAHSSQVFTTIPKTISAPNTLLNENFFFEETFPLAKGDQMFFSVYSDPKQKIAIGHFPMNLTPLKFPFKEAIPIIKSGVVAKLGVEIKLDFAKQMGSPSAFSSMSPVKEEEKSIKPQILKRNFKEFLLKWYSTQIGNIIGEMGLDMTKSSAKTIEPTFSTPSQPEYEKFDPNRGKMYIFGDDSNSFILEIDMKSFGIRKYPPPENLHLLGYSMIDSLPNGKMIITGGINKALNIIVPTCTFYDPISLKTYQLSEMRQARYTHTICRMSGFLYVLGGRYYGKNEAGVLKSCERYNYRTNIWEIIGELNEKRCTSAAICFQNEVYIFGGYMGNKRSDTIEKYVESKNNWVYIPLKMHIPIEAGFMLMENDKEAVYIGGKSDLSGCSEVTSFNLDQNN